MALLQISEPGMSADPHQRKWAIGIDLGTTNSLVAVVRSSANDILADAHGRRLLPSVVWYGKDDLVLVGDDAVEYAGSDPMNTIASVKRLMGRGFDDARRQHSPYQLVEAEGQVQLQTAQGVKSPVQVSAQILRALRERAEATLGEEVTGAVITVPAYFDDAQRQATKDAAALAGLSVLRLLNEPTAAALAYGLDNQSEGLYMVYDLGGGTFDVSVLRMQKGVFTVIATGGDSQLGGDDFDRLVAQELLQRSPAPPDGRISLTQLGARQQRLLLGLARKTKEALSDCAELQVDVGAELSLLAIPSGHAITLTRERLEQLFAPLVEKTLDAMRQALADAKVSWVDVIGTVMVGGSTRMPFVRNSVSKLVGKPVLTDVDPDAVVALGASLQANLLAGNQAIGDDWLLLDVIPLSLGLETMGGLAEKIIPRNSTIPTSRAQEFTTYKDGQTALAVHVVQGERELVSDCRSLARFTLDGIPAMAAGAARIRVTFQVDADGLLTVSAREMTSGVEQSVAVKPSYGLDDDDIARMLQESFGNANQDKIARALREQQTDASRLIESISSALLADGDLLTSAERQLIEQKMRELEKTATGDDHVAIREHVDALALATEAFAAKRMDKAIALALTGKSIDQL
jgi:molecular chaperone HscA